MCVRCFYMNLIYYACNTNIKRLEVVITKYPSVLNQTGRVRMWVYSDVSKSHPNSIENSF